MSQQQQYQGILQKHVYSIVSDPISQEPQYPSILSKSRQKNKSQEKSIRKGISTVSKSKDIKPLSINFNTQQVLQSNKKVNKFNQTIQGEYRITTYIPTPCCNDDEKINMQQEEHVNNETNLNDQNKNMINTPRQVLLDQNISASKSSNLQFKLYDTRQQHQQKPKLFNLNNNINTGNASQQNSKFSFNSGQLTEQLLRQKQYLKQKIKHLQNQLILVQKQKIQLEQQLSQVTSNYQTVVQHTSKSNFNTNQNLFYKSENKQLSKLETKYNKIQAQLSQKNNQLSDLKRRNTQIEQQLKNEQEQNNSLKQKLLKKEEQIQKLNQQITIQKQFTQKRVQEQSKKLAQELSSNNYSSNITKRNPQSCQQKSFKEKYQTLNRQHTYLQKRYDFIQDELSHIKYLKSNQKSREKSIQKKYAYHSSNDQVIESYRQKNKSKRSSSPFETEISHNFKEKSSNQIFLAQENQSLLKKISQIEVSYRESVEESKYLLEKLQNVEKQVQKLRTQKYAQNKQPARIVQEQLLFIKRQNSQLKEEIMLKSNRLERLTNQLREAQEQIQKQRKRFLQVSHQEVLFQKSKLPYEQAQIQQILLSNGNLKQQMKILDEQIILLKQSLKELQYENQSLNIKYMAELNANSQIVKKHNQQLRKAQIMRRQQIEIIGKQYEEIINKQRQRSRSRENQSYRQVLQVQKSNNSSRNNKENNYYSSFDSLKLNRSRKNPYRSVGIQQLSQKQLIQKISQYEEELSQLEQIQRKHLITIEQIQDKLMHKERKQSHIQQQLAYYKDYKQKQIKQKFQLCQQSKQFQQIIKQLQNQNTKIAAQNNKIKQNYEQIDQVLQKYKVQNRNIKQLTQKQENRIINDQKLLKQYEFMILELKDSIKILEVRVEEYIAQNQSVKQQAQTYRSKQAYYRHQFQEKQQELNTFRSVGRDKFVRQDQLSRSRQNIRASRYNAQKQRQTQLYRIQIFKDLNVLLKISSSLDPKSNQQAYLKFLYQIIKEQVEKSQKFQKQVKQLQLLVLQMEDKFKHQKIVIKEDYDVVYNKYLKYKGMCQNMESDIRFLKSKVC